jgi:mannose-6-phosphate isomerase
MNSLYPLKFEPIIKELIWGGTKLRDMLAKTKANEKAGESWEISCVKDNISVVTNGFLAGNDLQDLIEVYMGDLVGEKIFSKFGTKFPLLLKFIDACDDLSIQVHPNDKVAQERHNSFGKTEMWYVMQNDEGSGLISGFNRAMDKATYLKYLENKKLLEIMNITSVEPGDVFFMPAGRIHAINKGILLAEIQQTSDLTYRVYDYDRRDAKGNARELHTEQALDVIDYNYYPEVKTNYNPHINKAVNLADCPYFTTNILELKGSIERDMVSFDSFVIYMCIEGQAEISYNDDKTETIKKGETVLMPAEIPYYYIRSKGKAKLLEVYIAHKYEEDED